MEVIQSNKGGQKILYGGHQYTKQIAKNNSIRWRCVKRTLGCKGCLTTTLTLENPVVSTPHMHDPCDAKVQATKCKASMKQRAKESFDKPSQILAHAMGDVAVDVRVELGKNDSVKRTLRNQRLRLMPDVPETIRELVIEGEWAQTAGPDPQPFLLHDNGADADARIIAFGTRETLRQLSEADTWYMDGNHNIAPAGFSQLYVIRCPLGNSAILQCTLCLSEKPRLSTRSS